MSAKPPGLREQKKARTRQTISDQATRLFMERGFDRVTIADVAVAAEVSKMTVTNYFPRKEDLVFDLSGSFVGSLARTVRDRAAGESALTALRRAQLAAVAEQSPVIGFTGPDFARMIADSPALVTRVRDFHDERERALAGALADETGTAPDTVGPRTAAALLGAVHRLLFDRTQLRTVEGVPNPEIAAELADWTDRAFARLEPALADYATRAGESHRPRADSGRDRQRE